MPVTDVLGYLNGKGLRLKSAGASEVHMPCFFCNEDPNDRGRLYVNVDPMATIPGLFKCHLCDKAGNFTTLKRHFGDEETSDDVDSHTRYEIFQAAATHYHHSLADYEEVFQYLRGPERGLTTETISKHRLGYAGQEAPLYRHLRDCGFARKDIVATGLAYERDGRVVEAFSDMVTIPYFVAGNVVTIRGRAWPLEKGDKRPKYKSLPGSETRLFNSDFTWHERELVITEGEFDAMVLEQLGFPAVGVPGAAAWQDSWDGYFAEARRLYVVFDRDAAGMKGQQKMEERFGSKVRPIHLSLPGQKIDPTDWISAGHTAEDLQDLINEANRTGGILVTVDEAVAEFNDVDSTPGLKFGVELLDLAISPGLRPSQLMVMLAKTGTGKQEPVSSLIPTPDGYRRIGDLRPGDFVFGRDGLPTLVNGVFPQGVQSNFCVKFSDGSERVVGGEHLWEVHYRYGKKREWTPKVMTTKEIMESGLRTGYQDREWKYRIPMCEPVQYPGSNLPLDPYVLGALIANGATTRSVVLATPDEDVVDRVRRSVVVTDRPVDAKWCPRYGLPSLMPTIRELGLDVLSGEKFIPTQYLLASVKQRIDLLHGLMDGGGTSSVKGKSCVRYSTTSPRLADDLIELVCSLGGTASSYWSEREGKAPECTLTIMLPEGIEPFYTSRKRRGVTKYKTSPHRAIVSIQEVDPEESVCISVANDDSLYLTGDRYIVTHNTLMLLNFMQRMAMEKGQEDCKFLFLSLEQTRGEWFDRARRLHRFYNLNDTDEDAQNFWRDRLLISDRNRMTAEDVKQAIDDFDYRMGTLPDVICLDYLGYWARSFKGEEYQRLSDAVMNLKGLAKELRIPFIVPHQVNRSSKDGEEFAADAARGSGVIEETADFMMAIWSADNALARDESEKNGHVKMKILKSRHGGRGQVIPFQFAPLTLAMVPAQDPLASLAKAELEYAGPMYRDDWEKAIERHRTGNKTRSPRQGML